MIWSGRRDSNPRPQPWQGCALPLSYARAPAIRLSKRVRAAVQEGLRLHSDEPDADHTPPRRHGAGLHISPVRNIYAPTDDQNGRNTMDMLIGQKTGAQKKPGQRTPAQNPPRGGPGGIAGVASDEMIVDGTEKTFMQDVIEASRSTPVLVDFWATWCGPCKQLTPALEKVTRAAGGRIKLVKIDIDANRALVQQLAQIGLPLQSVPTVAAFWQGQVADLFQGALPESEIKRFVESLLKLAGGVMPAADLLAEARVAMEAERFEEAGGLFSALLQDDPENPAAWAGLIRVLMALGQEDQARDALEQIPPAITDHAEINGARSALLLAEEGRRASSQLGEFERRLAANADDHQARYDLAAALNAGGRRAEAAEALLHIIKQDRAWNDDAARLQLLKLFEAWGLTDPATLAARRKLSALLFR